MKKMNSPIGLPEIKTSTPDQQASMPLPKTPQTSHRGWAKGKPRKPRRDRQEPSYRLERVIEELAEILEAVKDRDSVLSALKKALK